jgi:hypothetical protein
MPMRIQQEWLAQALIFPWTADLHSFGNIKNKPSRLAPRSSFGALVPLDTLVSASDQMF